MFVEKYMHACTSSDLRDDEHHHATDALIAAALADKTGNGLMLGSLLTRVKYASGSKNCPAREDNLAVDIERTRIAGRAAGLDSEQVNRNIAEIRQIYAGAEVGLDVNMAQLLRIWTAAVIEKGKSREWIKARTEWDINAAFKLYEKVAHESLMHWLHGLCDPCGGSGNTQQRRICECCKGTGKAQIQGNKFESDKVRDMVSELEGLFQAHSGRAAAMLRRMA